MTPEEMEAIARMDRALSGVVGAVEKIADNLTKVLADLWPALTAIRPLLERLNDAPPGATETSENPGTGVDTPEPAETKGEAQ